MQSEKSLFQMQMNERSHEAASLGKPQSSNIKVPIFSHGEINKHIVHRVGDIVWTHLPDYPKWPGKVISAHSINKGNPEDDKVCIRKTIFSFLNISCFPILQKKSFHTDP